MPWEFIEQFKRMERWYKRIKIINAKVPKQLYYPEDEDEILAFFQNCFHLKDWVKNGDNKKIAELEVENFVNNSLYLKICGDICIGSKHLKINYPRIDAQTKITPESWLPINGHVNGPIEKNRFIIKSGDNTYEAEDLASKCIAEWQNFFSNKGYYWS